MGLLAFIRSFQFRKSAVPPSPTLVQPVGSLQDQGSLPDDLFILRPPREPWGDYGTILLHGAAHSAADGRLLLSRTGPFVPPINFPGIGNVVVTDEMRTAMIAAGFRGVSFRPVVKKHIVKINWHRWNWEADEPRYYPPGGEPLWYLDRSHSEQLSPQMGDLWEVVVSQGVVMENAKCSQPLSRDYKVYRGTRNDADLFSSESSRHYYCSLGAKLWFQKQVPAWVSFEPVAYAAEMLPPPRERHALAEETAIVLFAAQYGLIQPPQLRDWACSQIEAMPQPPLWILELATAPLQSNDDAFGVLSAQAAPLGHRQKLQAIIVSHTKGKLPLAEALAKLYRVLILDLMFVSSEDEPLFNALDTWDCLEDPVAIPEPLQIELRQIFQSYLADATEISRVIFAR